MLDHVKLNKMIAMMVGATPAEADNAYRAIVKMVRSSNVSPSNVHLHVYGDEDDYVGYTLKAKDDEIDQHLSKLESAYDEIEKLRAESGKVAALQAEIERLQAVSARLMDENAQLCDRRFARKKASLPLALVRYMAVSTARSTQHAAGGRRHRRVREGGRCR